MIHLIDEALERMLRATVPLSTDVDISFATPDRRWGGTVTRPTVNVFLWQVAAADPARTSTGIEQRRIEDRLERRRLPPKVALGYVVTAWGAEHRDEHQLLGGVLRAVLATTFVSEEHLPPGLVELPSIQLTLGNAARDPAELWRSLDGQLKPSLALSVSTAIDTQGWLVAADPPSSVAIAGGPAREPLGAEPHEPGPPLRRRRRDGSVVAEAERDQEA